LGNAGSSIETELRCMASLPFPNLMYLTWKYFLQPSGMFDVEGT
jgi:hypothetical protein